MDHKAAWDWDRALPKCSQSDFEEFGFSRERATELANELDKLREDLKKFYDKKEM